MSVRSFHSVFMATAVAGAALGCYLVSLRVASERAALEQVEAQIVRTQVDIRLLQTEVGTRARLAQLERWNLRALSLSAPSASQILGDKFQLARLVRPEPRLDVQAPVVLASAPAPEPAQPLAQGSDPDFAPARQLLHEASYEAPQKPALEVRPKPLPVKPAETRTIAQKPAKSASPAADKKAGDKSVRIASASVTRPLHTANVDPLAPLPAERSAAKGSRTDR
jgi:hypothetical protein